MGYLQPVMKAASSAKVYTRCATSSGWPSARWAVFYSVYRHISFSCRDMFWQEIINKGVCTLAEMQLQRMPSCRIIFRHRPKSYPPRRLAHAGKQNGPGSPRCCWRWMPYSKSPWFFSFIGNGNIQTIVSAPLHFTLNTFFQNRLHWCRPLPIFEMPAQFHENIRGTGFGKTFFTSCCWSTQGHVLLCHRHFVISPTAAASPSSFISSRYGGGALFVS